MDDQNDTGVDITQDVATAQQEDEGRTVHIRDKNDQLRFYKNGTDEKKPVTIRVAGTYSSLYRRTKENWQLRSAKLGRRAAKSEAAMEFQLEMVVGCIISWEGFNNAGAPFPFNPENARKLLRGAPWIMDDLWEAMNEHESFSRTPSAN